MITSYGSCKASTGSLDGGQADLDTGVPHPELREAWHQPAQTECRQGVHPEDGTGRLSLPIRPGKSAV